MDIPNESREILILLAEVQAEANRIADKSRPEPPNIKGPPDLNLDRLTQQLQAEAEIAGYCTTEKSRKDRRQALVRAGGVVLLALFQMDREKKQKLREAMERCDLCRGNSGIVKHPRDGQEVINALHAHGLGFMADGPPIAPAPNGLLVDHVSSRWTPSEDLPYVGVDLSPGKDETKKTVVGPGGKIVSVERVSDRSNTSDHPWDCGCRACSGSF